MTRKTTRAAVPLALAATLWVAGCGGSTLGVPLTGRMSVTLTDGGPGRTPAAAPTAVAQAGMAGPETVVQYAGSMTGSAQVYGYSLTTGWVTVGIPRNVSAMLHGGDEGIVAGQVDVPAVTYSRMRLVLTGFHAHLAAGSVVGPLTLSADTDLILGGSDSVVEIEMDIPAVRLDPGTSALVQFDLHSSEWITEQNVQAGTVPDAAIQSAVTAQSQAG